MKNNAITSKKSDLKLFLINPKPILYWNQKNITLKDMHFFLVPLPKKFSKDKIDTFEMLQYLERFKYTL